MIKFDNVYKTLGGKEVLQGMDFQIEDGEIFVIVGPSGTGKSVTLRHIIGLHKPDSGSVTVNGIDVPSLYGEELEKYRAGLGVLFQSGALLNWMNVRENVALPLREKQRMKQSEIYERVSAVLEVLELGEAEEKMPDDLSGGMIKRAGLARAIITNPGIVLYDEPTSGLDPVMSRKIDSLIVSLRDKYHITSIVVTHDLCSAFGIADRIAMIYDGKIVECGTPEKFEASSNEHVREFIAAQYNIRERRKGI